MSKTKKPAKSRDAYPKLPAQTGTSAAPPQTHAVRETVESIVIAFVLAFLFRTFEAEAFVIPTGSMAPTLMGRHKDVDCPKCGYRYQVSASEEESDDPRTMSVNCVAGMCPMCHYVLPMRPDLPESVPEFAHRSDIDFQRSYNGDRILVNKYIYAFSDPKRWDVVVFKFPGNAQINYIKRLVGLPGETLRIFQGDLFVGEQGAAQDGDFAILRKPPKKVLAMRQLVHDTNYDPAELYEAGWPLRWQAATANDAPGWQTNATIDGGNVEQRYAVDRSDAREAWLRYHHTVPDHGVWDRLAELESNTPAGQPVMFPEQDRAHWRSQLVTDANPYNGRQVHTHAARHASLEIDPSKQGLHWVGDLILEAEVEVKQARGELLLDLVEGGKHFRATIDLSTGCATLSAENAADFRPTAKTSIDGPGTYRVAFANVDDQLLLWVDGDLVAFEGETTYDAEQVFGSRRDILPQTSSGDEGDLAPAGIGVRNANLEVGRLRLWRDIYYIADSWERNSRRDVVTDFPSQLMDLNQLLSLPFEPSLWPLFKERQHVEFPLGENQFFVMGDNSAESSDARLWFDRDPRSGGIPGGPYLERELLIGKALCVYWPHSWNRIPGTPIPFPLFPNFMDMRLVR
jgi:signal peptidase I